MPSRGWAGAQATGEVWKCFVCLQEDNASRAAVTQVLGTMVCMQHVGWIPLNVYHSRAAKGA